VIGAPAFTYHIEGHGPHVPPEAMLCQMIDDPATAAWTPAGIAAVGSIRLAIQDLLARPTSKERSRPLPRKKPPRAVPSLPMTAAFVLQTLDELRDAESIVVEEAPTARPVLQNYLPITRSEGFYTMDSGGLGFGMPAAVGIALAKPGRRIVAIIGDGSAMYSIQALWTAAQWKLPILFLVLNNRRYAALEEFALEFGFRPDEKVPGTDLGGIDFAGLAVAQGCDGWRIREPGELRDALERALASPGPVLVEVEIQ